MLNILFSIATYQDADKITTLVNSAYRGETSKIGWTSEADLLDGRRTDFNDVQKLLQEDDSFILVCRYQNEIIGSVHLTKQKDTALLGMLAVQPQLQNSGIGKLLLSEAELFAKKTWLISKITMTVISTRKELITFYIRRGYISTGILKKFPINPELWNAKIFNLQLELLEKNL